MATGRVFYSAFPNHRTSGTVSGARCVCQEGEVQDGQKPKVTSGMTRAEPACLWEIFYVQPSPSTTTPVSGGQGDLRALQHHSDILRSLTYEEKRFVLARGAGVSGQIQTDLLLGTCWGCWLATTAAFGQTSCFPCSKEAKPVKKERHRSCNHC